MVLFVNDACCVISLFGGRWNQPPMKYPRWNVITFRFLNEEAKFTQNNACYQTTKLLLRLVIIHAKTLKNHSNHNSIIKISIKLFFILYSIYMYAMITWNPHGQLYNHFYFWYRFLASTDPNCQINHFHWEVININGNSSTKLYNRDRPTEKTRTAYNNLFYWWLIQMIHPRINEQSNSGFIEFLFLSSIVFFRKCTSLKSRRNTPFNWLK